MFKIQDEKGVVYNTVANPAAVFDTSCGTLLKIGEKDAMLMYFNLSYDKYALNGLQDMASNLMYIDLPRNQKEINKVFQITGYVQRLYNKTVTH